MWSADAVALQLNPVNYDGFTLLSIDILRIIRMIRTLVVL